MRTRRYSTPTLGGLRTPKAAIEVFSIVPRRRVASPAQRDTILTLESLHGPANVRRGCFVLRSSRPTSAPDRRLPGWTSGDAGNPPPLPRSHVLCPRMDFHGERSRSAEHLVTMEAKGRVGYGRQRVPHRAAIRICRAPGQDILSSRHPAVLSAIDP